MKQQCTILFLLAALLAGCSLIPSGGQVTPTPTTNAGMGAGSSMSGRHHAPIPEPYSSMSAPEVGEGALERAAEFYTQNCASCHGDGGWGDGPAGQALDPAPAPLARTSLRMSDGYLFWRMSEGGAVFASAMPAWKETLNEQQIWEMIAYLRALGSGEVTPQASTGGQALSPEQQAQQQAETLAKAVAQGVLSQEEADNFALVHTSLEERLALATTAPGETMDDRQAAIFAALVAEGGLTQAQVDLFNQAHDKLMAAGLEP
jgi:mono/diheme cytochrome c family protein